MRRTIAVAALVLAAGCESREDAAADNRVTVADGKITVGGGAGELRGDGMKLGDMAISTNPASAECRRPDYVPLPPGAKVTGCMAMGGGGQMMFEAPQPPAATIAFYKAAAIRAGLTDRVMEQGNVYSAAAKDGRSLVATASGEGRSTAVIWGMTDG